jgi:hypothetical protein
MARSSHLYVSIPVSAVNGNIRILKPTSNKESLLSVISCVGIIVIFLSRILIYENIASNMWVDVNVDEVIGVLVICIIIGIMVLRITIIVQVRAIVIAHLACGNKKRTIQNGAITSSSNTGVKLVIVVIKFTIIRLSWFKGVFVKITLKKYEESFNEYTKYINVQIYNQKLYW